MITFSNNNQKIDIEVEGYAYPFSKDEWDSNWLSIKVCIKELLNGEEWELNDTCLLTMELKDLKNWFKELHNKNDDSKIKFIEPTLSFYFKSNSLIIELKYNLNPYYDENNDKPYIIEIQDKFIDINTIVNNLEYDINKFPQKGNPK